MRRTQAPRQLMGTDPGRPIHQCVLCSGKYRGSYPESRFRNTDLYMGHRVCAQCRRNPNWTNGVLEYVFIAKVAKMECAKPLEWTVVGHPGDSIYLSKHWVVPSRTYKWCNLDCRCIPCTARKVLRNLKRIPTFPQRAYNPSGGLDELTKV